MEPLKPELKARILELRADVSRVEIEEYERLLSLRFVTDPDAPPLAPPAGPKGAGLAPVPAAEARRDRLAFLHHKLFGPR